MRRISSISLAGFLVSLSFFLLSPLTTFASGSWITVGSMAGTRGNASATVLPNGKVLVAGGIHSDPDSRDLTLYSEVYDPSTQTWSQSGNLNVPRYFGENALVVLANGKALLPGGSDLNNNPYATTELYDPSTGTWSYTGSMNQSRRVNITVLLNDGRVLVAGGVGGEGTSEIYDPSTGTWSYSGNLNVARQEAQAVLLSNGKVLMTGGDGPDNTPTDSAEIYDPSTGTWSNAAPMPYKTSLAHSLTLLQNGKVLLAGGRNYDGFLATAAIYDPSTNTWTSTPQMLESRAYHTAALLSDGKVIVVGGNDGVSVLNTTELYDPVSNSWSMGSNLQQARQFHAMVELPDNTLLAIGGYQQSGNYSLASTELYTPNNIPTVGTITAPSSPVLVNTAITASASFNDLNTADTHTASWNWGDGTTPTTGSVTESNGSGTVGPDSHTYTTVGVYTITLTVTDNHGGAGTSTYQYVAVYDSNTSFAGGRSFDNPSSASPNTTGKVSFGISAKYNNSNVLTGNAKMDFKAASLDFASTSLSSLATSNGKAYLKGSGTLNGNSGYTFLETGIDGSVAGGNDLIRFQIKDSSGNVVYDSQPGAGDTADPTTVDATGNIRVH